MFTALLLLTLTAPPADAAQEALVRALAERGIVYRHDERLAEAATAHAQTCANLRRGGHHNWNRRFHQLGGNVREVCAESWPGQDMEAAARECVKSWQSSPGHWRSLKQGGVGGFGMRRGRNGTWYGVGIMR